MVARRNGTPAPADVWGSLLIQWRRGLTRVWRPASRLAERVSSSATAAFAGPLLLSRGASALFGSAFVLGNVVSVVWTARHGGATSSAIATAIQSGVLAVVRFGVLAYVSRGSAGATSTRRAWLSSLGWWLFALTPALRVAAWVVSAPTAYLAISSAPGVERTSAARAVAAAWSVSAAIVVAAWLGRNIVVVLLAAGL